ncbi:MAG: SUMF1/EgtB/PvdO family nonheme iron enzyme, partial [Planctomycetota bacterium]|nr:SUMF1/EgtB/PvdO family nonheme iron enzyme [Planctomycetota bacterium]
AIVALAAGGVFWAVSSKSRPPRTTGPETAKARKPATKPAPAIGAEKAGERPKTTTPDGARLEDSGLEEIYEYATKYYRENPRNYEKAIEKFAGLESDARGTKWAYQARDEIEEVKKARQKAATTAIQQLQQRIEKLVKTDKYQDALESTRRFPANLKPGLPEGKIDGLSRSISELAWRRYKAIHSEAAALADAGNHAEAMKLYQAALAFGVSKTTQAATERIQELRDLEKAAQKRQKEKLRQAYDEEYKSVTELVRQRRYEDALRECDKLAADDRFKSRKARIARDRSDIEKARSVYDNAIGALPGQTGKPFSVKGIRGTLMEVKGGQLVLSAGGARFSKPIASLSAKELATLAAPGLEKQGGKGHLELAVFWHYEREHERASKTLLKCKKDGMDISPYESWLVPVLIVASKPSGAAIEIVPPLTKTEGKLETPLRAQVSRNTTYAITLHKEGYAPVTGQIEVGDGGEFRADYSLKKQGLPGWLAADFAAPTRSRDQHGNPVRKGIDKDTRYPLEIVHKKTGMHFAFVPPGTFRMGSPKDEKNRGTAEIQHKVAVSWPYYLGKYEVTVGEFSHFVKQTGYKTEAERGGASPAFVGGEWSEKEDANWKHPYFKQTRSHPVVLLSWNDAQELIRWLNKTLASDAAVKRPVFKMPTEAEWEYACRAGTATSFYWGEGEGRAGQYANTGDKTLGQKFPDRSKVEYGTDDGVVFTAPVGRYKPNAWGLYDISGNVLEWCSDWYGDYSSGKATDPTGPAAGTHRVRRGGGWAWGPKSCRSAQRTKLQPAQRRPYLGCRLSMRRTSRETR